MILGTNMERHCALQNIKPLVLILVNVKGRLLTSFGPGMRGHTEEELGIASAITDLYDGWSDRQWK